MFNLIIMLGSIFIILAVMLGFLFNDEVETQQPIEVLTTGFETLEVNIIRMRSQTANGLANTHPLASENADFGVQAELEAADPSTFLKYDEDAGTDFIVFLWDLHSQAVTYLACYGSKGVAPDMWTSSGTSLAWLYEDAKRGLFRESPNPIGMSDVTGALQAAADLEDFIEGYQWKSKGTGTEVYHILQIRRDIYSICLKWSKEMPEFTSRLGTNTQTEIRRTVMLFLCAAVMYVSDRYVLQALQSERAALNIGFTQKNLITNNVDPALGTAIADIWGDFAKKGKLAILGDNMVISSGKHMHSYTDNFIYPDLVNGTSIQETIDSIKLTFECSKQALKEARQSFGIGETKIGPLTYHFATLFDLWFESSGGSYDNHGSTQWCLGGNLAIGVKYFKDCENMDRSNLWEKAVIAHKHWSKKDLKSFGEQFFTVFNFEENLNGLAEPESFRSVHSLILFADSTIDQCLTTSDIRNPSSLQTSSVVQEDIWDVEGACQSLWMIGLLQDYLEDSYVLGCTSKWSESEIGFLVFFGKMLQTIHADVDFATNDTRWGASRIRLVEIIDGIKDNYRYCLAWADDEVIRYGHLKDMLSTTYTSEAMKYRVGLIRRILGHKRIYSAARTKCAGMFAAWAEHIGTRENQQQLLNMGHASSKIGTSPELGAPGTPETHVEPEGSDKDNDPKQGDDDVDE